MYNPYPFNPGINMGANYNPYQFNSFENKQNSLLKVNGLDGAKAYQMTPNSTVALFDANDDVFYVKSSDSGGFSNIKAFKFTQIENDVSAQIDTSKFVTRQEFEELKGALMNGKQFIQESNKQTESADVKQD